MFCSTPLDKLLLYLLAPQDRHLNDHPPGHYPSTPPGHHLLQEILGGDFVAENEDLHKEIEKFKHKIYSNVDRGFTIVEAVELLQIWCRASKLCLKEVQLLLVSSAHLDTFCEWVYRKRSMCTSQENAVALLEGGNGQHTNFPSQAFKKEANHVDA